MTSRRKKQFAVFAIVAGGIALSAFVGFAWHAYSEAQRYAAFGLWTECRAELDKYLWIRRGDAAAHLLYAEAVLKDSMVESAAALPEALAHLSAIPDTSPLAATARSKEAQIALVELKRPSYAEQRFRRAIELDPNHLAAWYGLWKLLDQTGRSHLAETAFWRTYELSPEDKRVLSLREWYMSQFFPAMANPVMDRAMGIIADRDQSSDISEGRRFQVFTQTEPKSPLGHVCWARWLDLAGVPGVGLESLYKAAETMENEESNPFYLHTVVATLIKMGELDDAAEAFQGWPADKADGYEYWVTRGAVLHEIDANYSEAAESYRTALKVWPGQVDWRTRSQLATCLAAMGKIEDAEQERARVKQLEQYMGNSIHSRLRETLVHLDNPEPLVELVEFYRQIDRPREAECWELAIKRMRENPSAQKPLNRNASISGGNIPLPAGATSKSKP